MAYFKWLIVSEIEAKGSEALTDTEATISFVVSGLTNELDAVTWEKPSDGGIITDGTEDYLIDIGTNDSSTNNQTTILAISGSANTADAGFTYVIQSDEHGKLSASPDKTGVNSNIFSE